MKKKIYNVISLNDNDATMDFKIEFPSNCPQCHTALDIKPLNSYYIDNRNQYPNLFVTFFCPHCEECFIGYYSYSFDGYSSFVTKALKFEPKNTVDEKTFPKHIKELSPDFCNIYNQAFASQQAFLNDISGMGYRKALEFLVKDYAILLNSDAEEKIKIMPLSKCITEYIDNRRIKKLALASAWIGNDETHYTKKNEEYNVDDLIAFIDAIVSFINSDISSAIAEKMINDKKSNN